MNTEIHPYLTFDGNCEEAFNFYKSVFGGEFTNLSRFSELPPMEGMPEIPAEFANRLIHVALPINGKFMLFGSDNGGDWTPKLITGNNVSLSISVDNKQEADRLFAALSQGGEAVMPMGDAFWGAYYGMLTDKFGIHWMINMDRS